MKLSLPDISIRPCLLALASVLILPAPAAHAAPMTFFANLSGANENPSNASQGTGLATIVLDPTALTLTVSANFSGLGSNSTMAHIHCCAAAPLDNTNIGVATRLPAFPGFPLGMTSGMYGPMIFDLTQFSSTDPGIWPLGNSGRVSRTCPGTCPTDKHAANVTPARAEPALTCIPACSAVTLVTAIGFGGRLLDRRPAFFERVHANCAAPGLSSR